MRLAVSFTLLASAAMALPAADFEHLYRAAFERRMEREGAEHPKTAAAARDLGLYLLENGRPGDAVAPLSQSLAIHQLAAKPTEVAADLEYLAATLLALGDGRRAEGLLERALAIRTARGESDAAAGDTLLQLADIAAAKGETAKAEALFRRAAAVEPDPEIYRRLADLREAQGDPREAQQLLRRALDLQIAAVGEAHPATARTLNDLGLLAAQDERLDEAVTALERALASYDASVGLDHPDAAFALDNLGNVRRRQGEFADAERLLRRALAVRRKGLGGDHPETARTLNNLAGLYHVQGRLEQAEPLYLEALVVWEKQLGRNHPDVGQTLFNLAHLRLAQGRREAARADFTRALEILEPHFGASDPLVSDIRAVLERLSVQGSGRIGSPGP